MTGLFLFARLLLAAVFAAAGTAKLFDRQGSRQAIVDFGVPEPLARVGGPLLPWVELAVAGALVVPGSARLGAIGALGLLVAFTGAMAVNLARGRTPDCHCFGQIHSAPVGPASLVRNGVLVALSAAVVWRPRAGGDLSWFGDLDPMGRLAAGAIAGLAAAVCLLGWAVVNLLRQQGRLLLRLDALEAQAGDRAEYEGLPVGSPAPAFALADPSGAMVALEDFLVSGLPLMLVFVHSNCVPCRELLPDVGRWQRHYHQALTIAVVAGGDWSVNSVRAREHHVGNVLLETAAEVAGAYRTTATPSAVLIAPEGRVLSPVVAGADAIHKLLLRAPDAVVHELDGDNQQ
jgi:methylamine utilization protein MauE/AhpC/TSA family protein